MDSHIVTATAQDVNLLLPMLEAYREFYGMPASSMTKDFLMRRIEQRESVIFIAYSADRQTQGFVQLYPLFSSVRLSRVWLLNDLFVWSYARNRGVARALISTAEKFALSSNGSHIELATQETNAAARSLYESMGWELDKEFVRYAKAL